MLIIIIKLVTNLFFAHIFEKNLNSDKERISSNFKQSSDFCREIKGLRSYTIFRKKYLVSRKSSQISNL